MSKVGIPSMPTEPDKFQSAVGAHDIEIVALQNRVSVLEQRTFWMAITILVITLNTGVLWLRVLAQ